jgi:Rha family phage regulatory protein
LVNIAIVADYGLTEKNGKPVVSSRRVAEVFGKRHDIVLRAIENADCSKEFTQRNFVVSAYKDTSGKRNKEYWLTKDGFAFVVMGFTGKKAANFKETYINRFNEMEQFIATRTLAKMEYPHLTDAIKDAHDPAKYYHFSNEADMINRIVLGVSAKEFRLNHNLRDDAPIRDHLSMEQIEAIVRLQKADEVLLSMFPDYKVRKAHLEAYYRKTVVKALKA